MGVLPSCWMAGLVRRRGEGWGDFEQGKLFHIDQHSAGLSSPDPTLLRRKIRPWQTSSHLRVAGRLDREIGRLGQRRCGLGCLRMQEGWRKPRGRLRWGIWASWPAEVLRDSGRVGFLSWRKSLDCRWKAIEVQREKMKMSRRGR